MVHILSMHTWTSLTSEQRGRIRALFNIPRSSHVVVSDGRIETDGTTTDDFKHLSVEKMQKYLSNDSSDFHKLFDMVLARVQDEIEGKPAVMENVIVAKADEGITIITEPKKRGRPAKKNV